MLIKAKALTDFRLDSLTGEVGRVPELYFDDKHWTIRYLVADTGDWLPGRKVLISPYALGAVSLDQRNIHVGLTKDQIEKSPALEEHKPVSRQFEELYYRYHDWPAYWSGPNPWGAFPYVETDRERWAKPARNEEPHEYHLRSTRDVSGHQVEASDGVLGHVDDFIVEDRTWAIRYLVVDTTDWWGGHKVLIAPRWIDRISWVENKVHIGMTRAAIQASPPYDPKALLHRDYEARLHRHYDRWTYWGE
jgi:hypothetical protein